MIELRPYQNEALEAIETAEKDGTNRQLVALPTGTGKTIIFTTIAKNRNGRTLILAHRDELIEQAVDKLTMVWDDANVGVVKAERNEVDKQVIVGSVQTVSRENRLEQLPTDFDFIVSDEAHHAPADTYRRIYKYLGVMVEDGEELRTDTLHLGVTATPQRTDKLGLNEIFDKIVFHRSIRDFIPDYLSDLRCVQIMTHINVDGVETWAGDLRTEQLSALLNTANCNELIVQAWKEHALGRLTLCFTTDVAHARDLCLTFQANDIKAAWVCGETPIDERRDILARFAQGEIEVLTNCAVLTEGYDCLSEDTEILTQKGWRGIESLQLDDLVLTLNPETRMLQRLPISRKIVKEYSGEMINIYGRRVDLLVTPTHLQVCRSPYRTEERPYRFVQARKLLDKGGQFVIDTGGSIKSDGLNLPDDFIRLHVLAATDGSVNYRNDGSLRNITLYQRVSNSGYIDDLIKRLGLKTGTRIRNNSDVFENAQPQKEWYIGVKELRRIGFNATLSILDFALKFNKHQADVFLEAFVYADGSKQKKHRTIYTSSRKEVDVIQAVAIMNGYSCTVTPYTPTGVGKKQAYELTITNRTNFGLDCWAGGRQGRKRRKTVSVQQYEGRVWCVTNANGTIVTRRNGKVAITGNCPALDCIILARPTKSTLLYTQTIGRGTRTYPGKKDCLILDVACISTEHNLVSFPSLFGLPLKEQDGEKTLTEQLEEKEAKSPGVLKGFGIRDREVDLFGEKGLRPSVVDQEGHSHDAYSMSNLAWVQLNNGFRLHLGKEGAINIYADFRTPTMYRVYYRSRTEKRQITRHPVFLSWAFGLAESEARRVTGGNLVLVDRNARWRQDPATDKQIAKLAEYGIYRPELTKGEASDLLAQIFARDDT